MPCAFPSNEEGGSATRDLITGIYHEPRDDGESLYPWNSGDEARYFLTWLELNEPIYRMDSMGIDNCAKNRNPLHHCVG